MVSISKELMFYLFGVVRFYQYLADLLQKNPDENLVNICQISVGLKVLVDLFS